MIQGSYYINLYDCNGTFITTYDNFLSIEYGRQKNDIGACNISMPGQLVQLSDFGEDYMIEIFRYNDISGQFELVGNTIWILQTLEYSVADSFNDIINITFFDTISILTRRYNLWFLHSTPNAPGLDYPSHLYRPVSDAILQLFNHNFGQNTAATIASMEIDPPPPVVTDPNGIGAVNRTMNIIAANALPATLYSPSVPYECDWKEVLASMKDLATIAENANIPVWFDIVYTPSNTTGIGSFVFNVWEKQRGNLKTEYVFGIEYGNFESAKYVLDFSNKKDVVVSIADQILDVIPEVDEKVLGLAMRSTYLNCMFHGKEIVVEQNQTSDITNGIDDNSIASLAQAELNAHKAVRKITGELINTPGQQFFVNFNYGDIVTVDLFGNEFYAEITKFSVTVDDSGEKISIPIESTQLIV